MPKQIFGAASVVATLNRAFNDQSPSNATFENQVAAAGTTTDSQMAFAKQFGAGYAGLSADALSTKLLGNLGVLPNAALQTALKDYITAAGVANVGIIALQLGDILSGLENATGDQAGFAAAAVAWNAEVTASYNYSGNPANTSAGPIGKDDTSTTGVTLTLGNAATDFIAPNATEAKYKTTANNDTIQATAGTGYLDSTDTIDGGAGKDTLNALIANGNIAPTISNVEVINLLLSDGANAINLANVTGAQEVWAAGASGSTTDTIAFNNVDKSFVVGIKSANSDNGPIDATVNYKTSQVSGLADTVSLAVNGVNSVTVGTTTTASKLTVNSVETVNLAATGAGSTLTLVGDSIETVNVTGDKALTLTIDKNTSGKTLKTIDTSASTAAVTVNTDQLAQAVTVKTGAGADTINGVGAGQKLTIDAGAGNDTIAFDANKAHVITLGAGNDTVQLNGTGAVTTTTAATLAASAVSITDFVVGTDKIKVGGGTIKTLTGTQFSAVTGSSDLKAAVTAAATAAGTGVGDSVFFQFGADTYVFKDNDGGGLSATDSLIKLTGVTSSVGDAILIA